MSEHCCPTCGHAIRPERKRGIVCAFGHEHKTQKAVDDCAFRQSRKTGKTADQIAAEKRAISIPRDIGYYLSGKRPCDLARELGISQNHAGQMIKRGKRLHAAQMACRL